MDVLVLDDASKDLLSRQLKTISLNSESMKEALSELSNLLPNPEDPLDGTLPVWRMDEVKMTLEVGAEGGLKLVGTATIAVTGGIEVTFRRPA